jgi:hypothetical protein
MPDGVSLGSLGIIMVNTAGQDRRHSARLAESRDAANRGIEANPGFSVPHAYLAAALVRMARMDEAKRAASNVLQRDPGFRIAGFRQTVGINPTVFEPYAAAWRQAGLPD